MEILGIGPLELMLVALITLLVVKPADWGKTGRTLASWINGITSSDAWRAMNESWRAASKLTTDLRREANLENSLRELDELTRAPQWTNPAQSGQPAAASRPEAGQPETNTIHPSLRGPYGPAKPIAPAAKKTATAARSTAKKSARKKTAPAKSKRARPKKTNA